jgi:hypothetical protein
MANNWDYRIWDLDARHWNIIKKGELANDDN